MCKEKTVIVSAWSDGNSGYGLKINAKDLHEFDRNWKTVKVLLPWQGTYRAVTANIDKESFWKKCHELISKDIKLWLKEQGLLTWEKNHPPHFEMVHVKENVFKITDSIK